MKFAKVLGRAVEDMPQEMQQQFLQYKMLKKKIKNIPAYVEEAGAMPAPGARQEAGVVSAPDEPSCSHSERLDARHIGGCGKLSAEEKEFLSALNDDLDKFNSFFMENEEMAVIKLQALSDAVSSASSEEDLQKQKARLVDFHGEVVLLLHWSMLNYAAVVKILKKHDKHSGVLLRAPFLANVLNQPFQSTNLMSRLVKNAEELVSEVLSKEWPLQRTSASRKEGNGDNNLQRQHSAGLQEHLGQHDHFGGGSDEECPTHFTSTDKPEAPMAKCTKMALATWASLARGASTPSTVLSLDSAHISQHQQGTKRTAEVAALPDACAPSSKGCIAAACM